MAPGVMGRPKKHTGKADFARTVCDSIKDGSPDLYNGIAKRVVTIEEAMRHGWTHYWDGKTVCPSGHVAARYVSNPAICLDCKRVAEGKLPLYPKSEGIDDLTGETLYVHPVASENFTWTPEKKRQLLQSWVNTRNFLKAIEIVGAQPTHVLDLLETDVEFKADYESAERKVQLVQLWAVEGTAAAGSERTALAMASNKFPQFGAKTGLAGRQTVNSEQARAELAQLLSTIDRSLAQQERLESVAGPVGAKAVGETDTPAKSTAAPDVARPGVLASPHDHSDLVSASPGEGAVSEADATLPPGSKV